MLSNFLETVSALRRPPAGGDGTLASEYITDALQFESRMGLQLDLITYLMVSGLLLTYET